MADRFESPFGSGLNKLVQRQCSDIAAVAELFPRRLCMGIPFGKLRQCQTEFGHPLLFEGQVLSDIFAGVFKMEPVSDVGAFQLHRD